MTAKAAAKKRHAKSGYELSPDTIDQALTEGRVIGAVCLTVPSLVLADVSVITGRFVGTGRACLRHRRKSLILEVILAGVHVRLEHGNVVQSVIATNSIAHGIDKSFICSATQNDRGDRCWRNVE